MTVIYFSNLYYNRTQKGMVIAKLEVEPTHNKNGYIIMKKYCHMGIPTDIFETYPWSVGIIIHGFKEHIDRMGSHMFELNNIDIEIAREAIHTIFEGVK